MKKYFLVGAGLSALTIAMSAKDPVIMTVNGVDVPKSEFEYLYHKNNQQQLMPQSLQEYVEMFKIYKLKVADAKASGIDTLPAFRKEMAQYRRELAQPYMVDSLFLNQLVTEAAERGKEEVQTSHIMLAKTRSESDNRKQRLKLDSIRKAILAGADFGEMANKYSVDRGSSSKGGDLGFITVNRYPYAFEIAAYSTPAGEVSEIIESPVGYHLIKSGERRTAMGKIHASHIMKMVQRNATPEAKARAKEQIDSIYKIVKANPSRFTEIAKSQSDDKGSAVNGGELPWFGPGEMVPEFEGAAFALNDGEISEPVESMYGWHIILRHGHKGASSAEELKPELLKRFSSPQDGRWAVINRHNTERLAQKHKAVINQSTLSQLKKSASTGIDSTFFARYYDSELKNLPIAEINKRKLTVGDYLSTIRALTIEDGEAAAEIIDSTLEGYLSNELIKEEEDWLYANNADYRNLLNEYHDGSLLYEISVKKVWDRAAKDQEGLDGYFQAHKDNYNWTSPHAKGILVRTKSDSLAGIIRERMDALPGDSILQKIRKEFKGQATIEKILVEKGTNPLVDYILFGGPEVAPTSDYTTYFIYNPKILNSPEEVNDVKGAVTGDYQTELETIWVEELKSKYPVIVDEKELKKVK